jgi:hypothetical protein
MVQCISNGMKSRPREATLLTQSHTISDREIMEWNQGPGKLHCLLKVTQLVIEKNQALAPCLPALLDPHCPPQQRDKWVMVYFRHYALSHGCSRSKWQRKNLLLNSLQVHPAPIGEPIQSCVPKIEPSPWHIATSQGTLWMKDPTSWNKWSN